MDTKEATFRGTIADLRHSRPQTAGTAPGTKLTIDTEALDDHLARRLYQLANGHPVLITISEIQDRMPLDDEPTPPEEMAAPVPSAFNEATAELDPGQPA